MNNSFHLNARSLVAPFREMPSGLVRPEHVLAKFCTVSVSQILERRMKLR